MDQTKYGYARLARKWTSASLAFTLAFGSVAPTAAAFGSVNTDPTMVKNQLVPNRLMTQGLERITIPRTLVPGDVLTLGLSVNGTDANPIPSAAFTGANLDEDAVLTELRNEIEATASGITTQLTTSFSGKVIEVYSSIPGVALKDLVIDRDLSVGNTRNAITAVAQVASFSLPLPLIAGDTVSLTLAGSGYASGTTVQVAYSGSDAATVQTLTGAIDALGFVRATLSGSLSTAADIVLTSTVPGVAFAVSDVHVDTSTLTITPIRANVVARAQTEEYRLSRVLESDEALSLTASGVTYTGSTIEEASGRIDGNNGLVSSVTGTTLTVASANPGTPFSTGTLSIQGGTMSHVTLIPNRIAQKQKDVVALNRDLIVCGAVSCDTLQLQLTANSGSVTKTYTGTTLVSVINAINADGAVNPYVQVTSTGAYGFVMESKIAGTPFQIGSTKITSTVNGVTDISNVTARAQSDTIRFPRNLVTGDTVEGTVNGSQVQVNFSSSSSATINAFALALSGATTNITTSVSGNDVLVLSRVAGNDYSVGPVKIRNSQTARTLVAAKNPVKQVRTYDFGVLPQGGEVLSFSVDGQAINAGSLNAAVTAVNAIGKVDAVGDAGNKTLVITAQTGGATFTTTDATLTGTTNSSTQTQAYQSEVKAKSTIAFNSLPTDGATLVIGNCTLTFTSGATNEGNCSDDAATFNPNVSLESLVATIGFNISNVTYNDGISLIAAVTIGGSSTSLTASRTSAQGTNVASVATNGSAKSDSTVTVSESTPRGYLADTEQLTLARDVIAGDTVRVTVNGVTVEQSIATNSGSNLDNLSNVLGNIEGIDSSRSGNVFTLSGDSVATAQISVIRTTTPANSVTADVGATQVDAITIPNTLVTGDTLNFSVNGTAVGPITFNGDKNGTFSGIIASSPVGAVTFSWSGATGPTDITDLLIRANSTGAVFNTSPLSILSQFSASGTVANRAAVKQESSITLPFAPESGSTLRLDIAGTQNGSFTTTVTTVSAALSDLATQASGLTGTVVVTAEPATSSLQLVSAVAGNAFTGNLSFVGKDFAVTELVANTGSQSQLSAITIDRTITRNDVLTFSLSGNTNTGTTYDITATETFTGGATEASVYQNLVSQVLSTLPTTLSGSYDAAGSKIVFESLVPGNPFQLSSLHVASSFGTVNVQPNVVAVKQIAHIDLGRASLSGDSLTLSLSGANQTGSVSNATISGLVSAINASGILGTIVQASASGSTGIDLVAATAGTPFEVLSFRRNYVSTVSELTANVVPVLPIKTIENPGLAGSDVLTVSIAQTGYPTLTVTGTSVSAVTSAIDGSATATTNVDGSGAIVITGADDVPFTAASASVRSVTSPVSVQTYIAPLKRKMEILSNTTDGTNVGEGWTLNLALNDQSFSYVTGSGETLTTARNALYNVLALSGTLTASGIVITTGSGDILVTTGASVNPMTQDLPAIITEAMVAGIDYATTVSTVDAQAPVIIKDPSVPTIRKAPGQSFALTGGLLKLNEPGILALVKEGTAVSNLTELLNVLAAGKGVPVGSDFSHAYASSGAITVPANAEDGKYDLVSIDRFDNVSMAMSGFLTVDGTKPILAINSANYQRINTDIFTVTGSSTDNGGLPVTITITNSGVTETTATDGSNLWSTGIALNQDTVNFFTVTATDDVGNSVSLPLQVVEDSTIPVVFFHASTDITNTNSVTFTGITSETGTLVSVTGGSGSVNVTSDAVTGYFSGTVELTADATNHLVATVIDLAANIGSGSFDVVQDSIAPTTVIFNTETLVDADTFTLSGATEANTTIRVNDLGGTQIGQTFTVSGSFSVTVPLAQNATNLLDIVATDRAGNTYSTGYSVTEDSVDNHLTFAVGIPSTVNADTITFTGNVKPGSQVTAVAANGSTQITTVGPNGDFSIVDLALTQDSVNAIEVSASDALGKFASGTLTITEDSTAPTVSVSFPTVATNDTTILLTGSTEPNAHVVITGGSGTASVVATASGVFATFVELNVAQTNVLSLVSTDAAGNSGTGGVTIVQDPVYVSLSLSIANTYVNSGAVTIGGQTKPLARISITDATGAIVQTTADASGSFNAEVALVQDAANAITVTASDDTPNTAVRSVTITEDSTNPTVSITNALGLVTNASTVTLNGTTEPLAALQASNSGVITNGSADGSGSYSITVPLTNNAYNTITVTATDRASNTGSGSDYLILQDGTGPSITNVAAIASFVGLNLVGTYQFDTSEYATAEIFFGTGTNVLATLIGSGTTTGTRHLGTVSGLTPGQTHFYVIRATDTAGNVTTSQVRAINNLDTIAPAISNVQVAGVTDTQAGISFDFLESNYSLFGTGYVTVRDTNGNSMTNQFSVTTGALNYANASFTGLTNGTTYQYDIHVSDDYDNAASRTGSFVTVTAAQTGSGTITDATGSVIFASGTVSSSGTVSTTGSIVIIHSDPTAPGYVSGTLTLSGIDTITASGNWDRVLHAPILIDPTAPEAATASEVAALVAARNTAAFTHAGVVISTIKVGAYNATVTASGGFFIITFELPSGITGDLAIFRSEDGNYWTNNSPDTQCTVSAANTCSFRTDHLSYFTAVRIVATAVPTTPRYSGGGGGGGGSFSVDMCPNGDTSPSYYDGRCVPAGSTATTSTSTNGSTASASGTVQKAARSLEFYVDKLAAHPLLKKYENATVSGFSPAITKGIRAFAGQYVKMKMRTTGQETRVTILKSIQDANKIQASANSVKARLVTEIRTALAQLLKTQNVAAATATPGTATTTAQQEMPVAQPGTTPEQPATTPSEMPTNVDVTNVNVSSSDTSNIDTPTIETGVSLWKYVSARKALRTYERPNFLSRVIAALPRNERVEFLGESGDWSKIRFNATQIGYVRSVFLREEAPADAARRNAVTILAGTEALKFVDHRAINVAHSLFVRANKDLKSKIVAVVFHNQDILVLDVVDGWAEIKVGDVTGFIRASYLR